MVETKQKKTVGFLCDKQDWKNFSFAVETLGKTKGALMNSFINEWTKAHIDEARAIELKHAQAVIERAKGVKE